MNVDELIDSLPARLTPSAELWTGGRTDDIFDDPQAAGDES